MDWLFIGGASREGNGPIYRVKHVPSGSFVNVQVSSDADAVIQNEALKFPGNRSQVAQGFVLKFLRESFASGLSIQANPLLALDVDRAKELAGIKAKEQE